MWKKIFAGILFVAACFASMYVLLGYYENKMYVGIVAGVLLVTAFIFLDTVFLDKVKKLVPKEEENEKFDNTAGEFQKRVLNHVKEMETTQKELLEVLKKQNTLLQDQISNLEHEIYLLSEKQVNQAKSIIKFNKENARQMAISERETLEYVMTELKDAIEKTGVRQVEKVLAEEVMELPEDVDLSALLNMEEVAVEQEEPFELPVEETVEAVPEIPDIPQELFEEVLETEDVTEEASQEEIPDLEALMAETLLAEEPVQEEPIPEEPKAEEPANPLAGLSADPNAMMTPEDIAKLLEAMGQ